MRKLAPAFVMTTIVALASGSAFALGDMHKDKKAPKADTNVKSFTRLAKPTAIQPPSPPVLVAEAETVPFETAESEAAVTEVKVEDTIALPDEPEADAIEAEAAEPAAPPARSLFANLRKPVN